MRTLTRTKNKEGVTGALIKEDIDGYIGLYAARRADALKRLVS